MNAHIAVASSRRAPCPAELRTAAFPGSLEIGGHPTFDIQDLIFNGQRPPGKAMGTIKFLYAEAARRVATLETGGRCRYNL